MSALDTAKAVKNALAANWMPPAPLEVVPTLHVDDDFRPAGTNVALLVADDGGPAMLRGRWASWSKPHLWASHGQPGGRPHVDGDEEQQRPHLRRPLLRLTAFAKGRDYARTAVQDAADWIVDHKSEIYAVEQGHEQDRVITRIDDVSDALITRDRATGAYLASITMPVVVRPVIE